MRSSSAGSRAYPRADGLKNGRTRSQEFQCDGRRHGPRPARIPGARHEQNVAVIHGGLPTDFHRQKGIVQIGLPIREHYQLASAHHPCGASAPAGGESDVALCDSVSEPVAGTRDNCSDGFPAHRILLHVDVHEPYAEAVHQEHPVGGYLGAPRGDIHEPAILHHPDYEPDAPLRATHLLGDPLAAPRLLVAEDVHQAEGLGIRAADPQIVALAG